MTWQENLGPIVEKLLRASTKEQMLEASNELESFIQTLIQTERREREMEIAERILEQIDHEGYDPETCMNDIEKYFKTLNSSEEKKNE